MGYGTAVHLVQSGVNRFHRIERVEGLENLPGPNEPMIIVGNHQNGLMDAIVQSDDLKPAINATHPRDIWWRIRWFSLPLISKRLCIDLRQRDKACCLVRTTHRDAPRKSARADDDRVAAASNHARILLRSNGESCCEGVTCACAQRT